MISIPQELLEQFERGNVLLFIGAQIDRDSNGQSAIDRLAAQLATHCDTGGADLAFPELAQLYQDTQGRLALVRFVRDQLEAPGDRVQPVHQLIAGLTACRVIITTGFDLGLERAFEQASRSFHTDIARPHGAERAHLIALRENLEASFNDSELHDLCFELNIDYEGLAGQSKTDKIRELVLYCERRGRTSDLIAACQRLRPHIAWKEETQTALSEDDERQAHLYKLFGSLDRPDSLILTEDDIETFFEEPDTIPADLQGQLARKTILFLGCDLDDPYFKRLYRKLIAALDDFGRRTYAFGDVLPLAAAHWCERHGINVLAADATVFLQALVDQLAARARPAPDNALPAVELPAPSLESPYKLLDFYEAKDAAIFFGRQRETQALSSLIHAHRLVLLYGASGTGKTSLLLAGAAPRLQAAEPPYTMIYARALEDPSEAMRRAIGRRLPEAALPTSGLVDFLAAATRALDRPLVLVLDQFEEFFIRLSPQYRAAFIAELGALYDARDIPVKVVLSLREDWLAAVGEIERRIPDVFRTRMRLLPLAREQARLAITAPAERLGVYYEPALVERLLDDLTGTGSADVMPPQLQLVCSALYGALGPTERLITLAGYERLGGARGVLQRYLEDELARLEPDRRALARGVLEELVTSQGTKAVKTAAELALGLDVEPAGLADVLEVLVRARLLRVIDRQEGGPAYELAHEYLINQINLGAEAQKRKQAEELIRQEVENWRRFDTLLGADKLALINEMRAALRLDDDAQELLLRSAIEVGDEIGYWLGHVTDPARRIAVLADTTNHKLATVRRRAAEGLGTQDVPEAVEPLLELALRDPDPAVRVAARASVARLKEQHTAIVARLRVAVESKDRAAQHSALSALTLLPQHDLPARLRLQVRATQARLGAEWLVATPGRRAITLPIAAVLVAIILAYTLAVNSYYIDSTQPFLTDTLSEADNSNELVIRHGLPWLPLPGLNGTVVHTGIPVARVPPHVRQELQRKRLWGLWSLHGDRPYEKWGKDLAVALYLEDGLPQLWYLNEDEGLKAIEEATESSDPLARRWSAYALEQIALLRPALIPQATGHLARLLDDSDSRVRATAAAALGAMPPVPPATAAHAIDVAISLLDDDDYAVRGAAAASLGRLAAFDPKAAQTVPQMIALLNDDYASVRETAATTLLTFVRASPESAGQIATALQPLLDGGGPFVRAEIAVTLGQIDPSNQVVIDQVVKSLKPQLSDNELMVRANATTTLVTMAKADPSVAARIVALLTPQLQDQDAVARARAISTFGQLGASVPSITGQIISLLTPLLKDDDASVRGGAVWALGQIVNAYPAIAPQIIPALMPLLNDPDPATRLDAATNLGTFATTPPETVALAIATLTPLLDDPSDSVRARAQGALFQIMAPIRTPASMQIIAPKLIPLLNHPNPSVRIFAARGLGQTPGASAAMIAQVFDTLERTSNEKEGYLRYEAAQAFIQTVVANPSAGAHAVAMLTPLLDPPDGNKEIRQDAAFALTRVLEANPAVVPPTVAATLYDILNSYNIEQQSWIEVDPVVASPIEIFVQQALLSEQGMQALTNELTNPLNSEVRPLAAGALFQIALRDPSRGQALRARLQPLAGGSEPVGRLWSNITLHLIDIADLAHQAKDTPAERAALIRELERRSQPSPTQDSSRPFFAYDTWAAGQALVWLKQQDGVIAQ